MVDFRCRDIFTERFSGDGQATEIEVQSQSAKQCRQPTGVIKIFHEIFAAGTNVGEQRSFSRERVEIVERNFDSRAPGQRDEVNHSVRGAAEREDGSNRVVE